MPPGRAGLRVCVCSTSGRRRRSSRRSARIAASIARGDELALQLGQAEIRHAELVRERLHRRLARRNRAGDDEHVVAARALPGGELEHRQRRAADVQPRDHVHDLHSRRRGRAAGRRRRRARRSPPSGVPPKSPRRRARRPAAPRQRQWDPVELPRRGARLGARAPADAADVPSSEQEERLADHAELVEHLVERLLRDERAVAGGK